MKLSEITGQDVLEVVVVFLKGFGLIGAAVALAYKAGATQWADDPNGIPTVHLQLIKWGMFEAGCIALVTFLSTSFGKLTNRWANGNGDGSTTVTVTPGVPTAPTVTYSPPGAVVHQTFIAEPGPNPVMATGGGNTPLPPAKPPVS